MKSSMSDNKEVLDSLTKMSDLLIDIMLGRKIKFMRDHIDTILDAYAGGVPFDRWRSNVWIPERLTLFALKTPDPAFTFEKLIMLGMPLNSPTGNQGAGNNSRGVLHTIANAGLTNPVDALPLLDIALKHGADPLPLPSPSNYENICHTIARSLHAFEHGSPLKLMRALFDSPYLTLEQKYELANAKDSVNTVPLIYAYGGLAYTELSVDTAIDMVGILYQHGARELDQVSKIFNALPGATEKLMVHINNITAEKAAISIADDEAAVSQNRPRI